MPENWKVVLGSRSPRRQQLLRLVVPSERIVVVPPTDSDEPGFDEARSWSAVESRVLEVARHKCEDVGRQLQDGRVSVDGSVVAVVTADTVVVATETDGRPVVLGQPRAQPGRDWRGTVRHWFRHYYAGRSHVVLTAVCVQSNGRLVQRLARSEVTFTRDVDRWLEWYLSLDEPLDKAGGYGIQGAADVFVTQVNGSVSNVVGFPLRDVLELFDELQLSFVWRRERERGTAE